MTGIRDLSRKRWSVLTAVLAAIAVIAAILTVPGVKAEAAEPTDFVPNMELGGKPNTQEARDWGSLTWAGPRTSGTNGNAKNDVGWAWCIDPQKLYPVATPHTLYAKENATKLDIPSEYRDAVIRLALKWQEAVNAGDKAAAGTYIVYMAALVGKTPIDRSTAAYTINGEQPAFDNPDGKPNYPKFAGSLEEFTELTGLKLVDPEAPGTNETGAGAKFEKVAEIPSQPAEYFITVIPPKDSMKYREQSSQRVLPPDQPGLPDNPDSEGGSEQPTTSDEKPSDEMTSENPETSETPGDETSSSETTTESEPSDAEGTSTEETEETSTEETSTENSETTSTEESEESSTEETSTEETDEPTPEKSTEVVPHPNPTPTTEKQQKELKPEIKTEASLAGDKQQVIAGATVLDKVHYEDLVPGKEYTLNAELHSKAKDENGEYPVIGHGEKTFTPSAAKGTVEVKITVDETVTEDAKEAVAFEYLTSTEVDKHGEDSAGGEKNDIAKHADIEDEDQTVKSDQEPTGSAAPRISTNADFEGDLHKVVGGATVVDQVAYEGLTPGKQYTLDAQLISKEDGTTVLGTGEKTFTPTAANGTEDVTITVNDDVTEPVEAAVAFEALTSTEVDKHGEDTLADADFPNQIAQHTDLTDEAQTVISEGFKKGPKISTNADFAEGSHEVVAGAEIIDTVSYEGLVPGKEYTLSAELISKADGKTVLGKGEKTFTPAAANGTEDVTITVNDDVTEPVEAAVAFEELTSTEVNEEGEDTPDAEKPNKVAEHKDIDDKDQTVTSEECDTPGDKPNKGKIPWWAILIPGIGLGKIIHDHHHEGDHDQPKDHHKDHPKGSNEDEPNGESEQQSKGTGDNHTPGKTGEDQPGEAGQSAQDHVPGKTGTPLPADAGRTEIKSVPSGATELDPGVQGYIK